MKTTLLLLCLPMMCSAQRIARHYDHAVTGEKVLESSEEWLSRLGENATVFYVLRKEGQQFRIYLKLAPAASGGGKMYTIQPKDAMVITFENDSVIYVPADAVYRSCIGCAVVKDCPECERISDFGNDRHGSVSVHTFSPGQIEAMKSMDVKKVGMQTSIGEITQVIRKSRGHYLRTVINYMSE